MMNFTILIPLQLFCILLFSKTFVRANSTDEIKVLIKWRHLPGVEDLVKLSDWTERFELNLFRLSYEEDPYFGRKSEQPIASGKTGRYDFATLIVPPQQIGTQNVEGKGKEVAESSSSRKGKRMAMDSDKDLYELEIKIISPEHLNIQQPPIIKRLNKLPKVEEILVCKFHTNKGCSISSYEEQMKRNIIFEIQDHPNFQIEKIECTNSKELRAHGMEYEGQVCPSDKYTIHFIGTRENKHIYHVNFPFNCDEAFYEPPKINHYQLWILKNRNVCKLKLIEENIEEGKNKHDLQIMETPSNTSSSAVAHSQQLIGHHSNPIPPFYDQLHRQMSQQIAASSQLLHHQLTLLRTRSHLLRSNTMPSDVRNMPNAELLSNLQGQSSNPIHGSSVAAGQNPPTTNFQPSQIAGTPVHLWQLAMARLLSQKHGSGQQIQPAAGEIRTLSQSTQIAVTSAGHPQRQHLPHHSDIGHSASQRHDNVQQIQPAGGTLPQASIQFRRQSQRDQQGSRPYIAGGRSRLHSHPSGPSTNLPSSSNKPKKTEQLLDRFGKPSSSEPDSQMAAQGGHDNKEEHELDLVLGSIGQKRGHERDGEEPSGEKKARG